MKTPVSDMIRSSVRRAAGKAAFITTLAAFVLSSGHSAASHGAIVCNCNCYYNGNCDDEEVCEHFVVTAGCIPSSSSTKHLFCPADNPGPCDGVCVPSLSGSPCGSESPDDLAAVMSAWGVAYTRAGKNGGGPIGELADRAYKLGHKLISSAACREVLARSALNLQEICRSDSYLVHPEDVTFHREEDHGTIDISADRCSQEIGDICTEALELELHAVKDPAAPAGPSPSAHDVLSRIPTVCPNGQTLGSRCEGARDEIGCLGLELHTLAVYIATPPLASGFCGDGKIDGAEECEPNAENTCSNLAEACVGCHCVEIQCE